MSYDNHFYKCGCFVRDTDKSNGVHIVFSKCKNHAKEFKRCSWNAWAKKNGSSINDMTTQADLERAKPKMTLDEILLKFKSSPISTMTLDGTIIHLEEAKAAIIELIKAQVPEKHLYANGEEALGWNECRELMLERLNNL